MGTDDSYDRHCESMLHTYGERGARGVLARAHLRGEERFMWHCPWRNHWHVTDKPLSVLAEEELDRLPGDY